MRPSNASHRKDLICNYPSVMPRHARRYDELSDRVEYPSPQSSVTTPSQSPAVINVFQQPNEFPAVLYLDFPVFQQCKVEIPKPYLPIPPSLSKLIGDSASWETITTGFFASTHIWMPIISRKRFYEHIASSVSGQLRSDYALLLLCMKSITWSPHDQDPRSLTYLSAKSFYLELEIGGIFSIQVLQAGILIALFEFGHALYPSAVVSIEACARYGRNLDINWDAACCSKPPFSWVELEEQNRVWWAVVMLDRFVPLGWSFSLIPAHPHSRIC